MLLMFAYLFITDETVCELWTVALMLICDDNSEVRLRAGLLCRDELPVVPQKSLECLLDNFVDVMSCSPSLTLVTLLAVAVGPLPNLSNFEADEVIRLCMPLRIYKKVFLK